jgi:hypothetical protein
VTEKRSHEISLNDCCGDVIVVDVYGYVSHEFGKHEPVFKLTRILLSDGRTIDVEGEHDMPYLCDEYNVATLPGDTEAGTATVLLKAP